MTELEFPDTGKRLYLPETFGECDRDQARDVARVLFNYQHTQIPFEELLTQLFIAITQMKVNVVDQEITENIAVASHLCNSFFENVGDKKSPILDFQDNPFLWLRPSWSKMYGPKDLFENISWGQYVDALDAFAEYNETDDVEFLNLLCAILFRGNTLSRKRDTYNRHDNKRIAKSVGRLDIGYRYGFWLYFASFQKYLSTSKVYREGRELDMSIIFDSNKATDFQSSIPGIGMLKMTLTLAASGEFGDRDKVEASPMWEILLGMYDLTKRDLDDQARSKAAKK